MGRMYPLKHCQRRLSASIGEIEVGTSLKEELDDGRCA